MGAFVNGHTHLLPTLLSHQPIDLVIIMLGTNDFKARFKRSVEEIAQSILDLTKISRNAGAGSGRWREGAEPKICVVAPPALGRRADDPTWDRSKEWLHGRDKSLALPAVLRAGCDAQRLLFVDANDSIQSSEVDPIHWSEESHATVWPIYGAHSVHGVNNQLPPFHRMLVPPGPSMRAQTKARHVIFWREANHSAVNERKRAQTTLARLPDRQNARVSPRAEDKTSAKRFTASWSSSPGTTGVWNATIPT